MGVGEAHGFHGAVAEGFRPALRHHFNGQAAVEIGRGFFPFLEVTLVAIVQGLDEGFVLRLVHGAIDVVLAGAAIVKTWANLVVARLEPGHIHVDRFPVNDRGNGIKKCEVFLTCQSTHGLGEGRGRQRPGGHNDIVPFRRWQPGHFPTFDCDQGMGLNSPGHFGRKPVPIHRQSSTCRNLMQCRHRHDQRARITHFLVQQAHGIVVLVVAAERVGANEFGQTIGLVGVGCHMGTHFVQHHGHTRLGRSPGGLAARHAPANHMYRSCHTVPLSQPARHANPKP